MFFANPINRLDFIKLLLLWYGVVQTSYPEKIKLGWRKQEFNYQKKRKPFALMEHIIMKSLISKSLLSLVAYGLVNYASASVMLSHCKIDTLKFSRMSLFSEEVSQKYTSSGRHERGNHSWLIGNHTGVVIPEIYANDISSIVDVAFSDLKVDLGGTKISEYPELSFVHSDLEIVPIATQTDSSNSVVSVPEPSAFSMVLLGLLGLALARTRMKVRNI